jgi:hypothetical protein
MNMTPDKTELWLEIQHRQMIALESIAASLQTMAGAQQKGARHTRPIAQFKGFDWSSINATVDKSDRYGAAVVHCNGHIYTRKSKPDFGDDVWFSRSLGKGEDGRSQYDVLIKFIAPPKVRSLSQDLVDALG